MRAASAEVAGLPSDTWLSAIDTRRVEFALQLNVIRGYVDAAARGARISPTTSASTARSAISSACRARPRCAAPEVCPAPSRSPRRSKGSLTFRRFGSNAALLPPTPNHVIPTGLDFGAGYNHLYGPSLPTSTFADSNVSPNFPYAAQIWAEMWERTMGQHIDGVLAVDPTVLSYFLAATGPAQLPDGTVITSTNVAALTEKTSTAVPEHRPAQQFEVDVFRATSRPTTSGTGAA